MIRRLTYLDYSNTKPRTLAASSYVKKHGWSDSEDDMKEPDDETSDDTLAKRRSLLPKLRLVLNKPHSYLVSLEIRCSKKSSVVARAKQAAVIICVRYQSLLACRDRLHACESPVCYCCCHCFAVVDRSAALLVIILFCS